MGAIIGVGLSLVPLVVVQQISEGMIAGITERFVELGTYHLQAVSRYPLSSEEIDREVERLAILPGVVSAAAERQGFALLYSDAGRSGVTVRAVDAPFWRDDAALHRLVTVTHGEFDLSAEEQIVIGVAVAESLQVGPGDTVRMLTVRSLGSGRYLPRISRFVVSGVISTGYRDLDRLWTFVELDRGRTVLSDESSRDIIGIKIDDPFALPSPLFNRGIRRIQNREAMDRALQVEEDAARVLSPEWFISDWYNLERSRYISFQTTRNLLVFIMIMILVVAAINISSSLIMLVLEKETEIAILRAAGTPRGVIVGAFIWSGLTVGLAGTALGSAVGIFLSVYINEILRLVESILRFFGGRGELFSADFYLESIPVTVDLLPLALSAGIALTVSLLSSLIPALRAAGIRPERILRRHA